MSLINVIAAAHGGQCFALLARRLQVSEGAAARGTTAIVSLLLPLIESEVASEAGMAQFLRRLTSGGFGRILEDGAAFSDSELRMQGRDLAQQYLASGAIDKEALNVALAQSTLSADQFAQLVPHATVLMLAAVQRRLERPLREVTTGGPRGGGTGDLTRRIDARATSGLGSVPEQPTASPGLIATLIGRFSQPAR